MDELEKDEQEELEEDFVPGKKPVDDLDEFAEDDELGVEAEEIAEDTEESDEESLDSLAEEELDDDEETDERDNW